jgi:hypothetical protein
MSDTVSPLYIFFSADGSGRTRSNFVLEPGLSAQTLLTEGADVDSKMDRMEDVQTARGERRIRGLIACSLKIVLLKTGRVESPKVQGVAQKIKGCPRSGPLRNRSARHLEVAPSGIDLLSSCGEKPPESLESPM